MPTPFRVVVTDFLDETEVEAPILGDIATLECLGGWSESDLAGRIEDASILLVYHDIPRIGDATFRRLDRCVGVIRAGVGYNNLDVDAASARGIVVCNVPDYGTEDVADHALMMLLAVARKLVPCHSAICGGDWHYRTILGAPRMRGKTLGIVGIGRIGSAMALRAKALGLDVAYYDPHARPGMDKALGIREVRDLREFMAQCDFVSLHCDLNPTSYHLINRESLAAAKPGLILVNTARGPVVDQEALLEALNTGHVAAAGLDVVEREPLDDDRLRHHPRILFTPHAAFYTVEGFIEMRRKAAEEARRLLLGQSPRCPVNLAQIPTGARRVNA
jgi:phosphoglycerate dehydrogenase-like enzyme